MVCVKTKPFMLLNFENLSTGKNTRRAILTVIAGKNMKSFRNQLPTTSSSIEERIIGIPVYILKKVVFIHEPR